MVFFEKFPFDSRRLVKPLRASFPKLPFWTSLALLAMMVLMALLACEGKKGVFLKIGDHF